MPNNRRQAMEADLKRAALLLQKHAAWTAQALARNDFNTAWDHAMQCRKLAAILNSRQQAHDVGRDVWLRVSEKWALKRKELIDRMCEVVADELNHENLKILDYFKDSFE